MKLLVDIGNTRTKAVMSEGGVLKREEFSLDLFDLHTIEQLTFASVRHDEHTRELVAKAKASGAEVVEVKTAKQAFGVECAYENFQTLGIDRWLAVLGAVAQYPDKNVIVVDAGTATTVDFVTKDKKHLGGWITPGLQLMTSSIAERADKVFDDEDTEYRFDIGVATPAALKYGCLAAQLGLVRQAIECFPDDFQLILAGGTASLMLQPLADLSPQHDDLIVFRGLDLY